MGNRIGLTGAAGLAGLVLLSACNPPIRQYDLHNQSISCEEANRLSYETLTSMGYSVTGFTPASPMRKGEAKATRKSPVSGKMEPVTVVIECAQGGVNIDASEDGKLLGQIEFKRGFHMTFGSVRSMAKIRAEQEQKQAAGEPESKPRGDLNLRLEPVPGQASRLDFDFDLSLAGVLPVRVRIQNPTTRGYTVDLGEVRLTRADRERVGALAVEDVARRMAAARTPQGEPATTLGVAEITDRLRAKLFATTTIKPQSDARGFLFFPLAQYKRARVVMTEQESGESEGFAVEF